MLRKRLALNFSANLYSQFVNSIVQLVSVPLFLAFWSKERYGIWILISQIPDCLAIGDAGFATTSANEVSIAIAQGDRERALRSLQTTWGFLLAISAIISAVGIASFFLIPWSRWLTSPEISIHEIRWTVLLFIFFTIIGISMQIFRGIYRADYKNARFTALTTSGKLAEMIAMGLAVASGQSMICAISWMFIVRLVTFAVLFADARNFEVDLPLGLAAFEFEELKQSWRPSVMFMASTLGRAIYIQGLTLLVGASLGAGAVVVFNTTRTISRVIVQFVGMIQLSIWPEFSYLLGIGDFTRARRLNGLSLEVAWVGSIVLAGVLFSSASWIVPLWTHHAMKSDQRLMLIFLTSAVLNGLWSVMAGLLMGTNQHEGLTIRYVMAATASLLLGALVVHPLGVYGVGLTMIVCELALMPFVIFKTCQILSQSVKDLLLDSLQLRTLRLTLAEYYDRLLVKAAQRALW
jgi:O-antigen/teichoic acid export membrane protein